VEVRISRGEVIKRYLSDVRKSTRRSQKSEPQKPMAERVSLERAQEDVSCFHFYYISQSPSKVQKELKDCPDTAHARSYLIRNPAAKIEGKTIDDKRWAETMHHNSIFE
jgi:hypothetical protein